MSAVEAPIAQAAPVPAISAGTLPRIMRQFELVERVKAYDPSADEDALNRAYVFSMKAHGSQMRALRRPLFLASGRGGGHPRRDEARRLVDHHRAAARHGRGHGRDARGYRARVRRRHRAPRRWRDQAVAPRAAIRPDAPGREFQETRARHVGGHPRPAGQARRPAAQHADIALRRRSGKAPPHRARDDGDLRAPGRAHGHARDPGRARGSVLRRALSRRAREHHRAARLPQGEGRGPAAPHHGRAGQDLARKRHRGRAFGPREVALFDLAQDAEEECRLRATGRHHGVPRRRRGGRAVLPRAGRAARALPGRPRPLQGLYLDAEAQQLPLAPHRRDRPRAPAHRGADPHARDARSGRTRHRRALGL